MSLPIVKTILSSSRDLIFRKERRAEIGIIILSIAH